MRTSLRRLIRVHPSRACPCSDAGLETVLWSGTPERLRKGRRKWDYLLSGRVRCREYGRAMVGQTQHQKYRYYRCRAAFAGPKHDRCGSKYVRADGLEDAVRAAATEVLSRPEIVMAEIRRQSAAAGSPRNEAAGAKRRLRELAAQRGRLLRLFQLGEID